MSMSPIVPVLLCGGAGTRLWPVSRQARPKPFMALPDGETLLQKAYRRALAVSSKVLLVTNQRYQFACAADLANMRKIAENNPEIGYLLEPIGRNTAPAIALAAHYVQEYVGPEAILLVLPADHLITDTAAFAQAVHAARKAAEQGLLVTFGITPEYPETGFGYLEKGLPIETIDPSVYRVARFIEKPDLEKAKAMQVGSRYLWNSGMFCFQAGAFLRQLQENTSWAELATQCWQKNLKSQHAGTKDATAWPKIALDETFTELPEISVDYAVMEKSAQVAVVPGNMGWSDIGSWGALAQLQSPDTQGNRALPETIFVNAKNNYVQSDRVVAAIGVQDLVIVDTEDALLVAHRDQVQEVKQVVSKLKQQGHEAAEVHSTVHRPWGSYTVLEEGPGFKVKRIEVRPGQSLSLQLHYHRAEHWVVVQGMAKVLNDGEEFLLRRNESTYIRAGHQHRLENPGTIDLVMIEVQSGEYLGEDDIVRFEDRYGRT